MKRTDYEWVLETTDENGDVVDADFSDKFPGLPTEDNVALALVYKRAEGPDEDGLDEVDRGYAYVDNGTLPEQFDNGVKVPKRYHTQMSRKARRVRKPKPEAEPRDAGDFLSCPRPKGAPRKGARIVEVEREDLGPLTVTDYLASQFIAQTDAGDVRIIHAGKVNWRAAD